MIKDYEIQIQGDILVELYRWQNMNKIKIIHIGVYDNVLKIQCTYNNLLLVLHSLNNL